MAEELISLARAARILGVKGASLYRRRDSWFPLLGARLVGGRWRCSRAKVMQVAAGAGFTIVVDAMDPRAQGFLALIKEAKRG